MAALSQRILRVTLEDIAGHSDWDSKSKDLIDTTELSDYEKANFRTLSGFIKPRLSLFSKKALSKDFGIFLDDADHTLEDCVAFSPPAGRGNIAVVDPIMIRRSFYIDQLRGHQNKRLAFNDRAPLAYWRGALTGYLASIPDTSNVNSYAEDVLSLPRSKLCQHAHKLSALINAKITSADQWLYRDYIISSLQQNCILSEPEPFSENYRYQLLIDIDGNSNSWPGFFMKLGSGSCVLKVSSKYNFFQWYYRHLRPWKHYVPVENETADLEEKVRYLIANETVAEEIATNSCDFVHTKTAEEWAELACRELSLSLEY